LICLISQFLSADESHLAIEGMVAINSVHSQLPADVIFSLISLIFEHIPFIKVQDPVFRAFLDLLGTVMNAERPNLTNFGFEILNDILADRNPIITSNKMAIYLPSIAALAKGTFFAESEIHHTLVFPFMFAQLDSDLKTNADPIFNLFAQAFKYGILSVEEMTAILDRGFQALRNPEVSAEMQTIMICFGAALRCSKLTTELRIGIQQQTELFVEKYRIASDEKRREMNCRTEIAAVLLLLGVGELSLIGEEFPGEPYGLELFMEVLLDLAGNVTNEEVRVAIARKCYEFLGLPGKLIAMLKVSEFDVIDCVANLDPGLEILSNMMNESLRQREGIRGKIIDRIQRKGMQL
jgi:hypothetical protein